jgi:hypothetical protein
MAYPGSKLYKMAVDNGWELPESWIGYSQHSYETHPLCTERLTSAEVLAFRDRAFQRYFANPAYLNSLRHKFGDAVVAHVQEMTNVPLRRKLLEQQALV